MTEEQTSVIDEAVAQPSISESVQDAEVSQEQSAPEPRRESDQDHNWREARRKMESLEESNQELRSKLNALIAPKQNDEEDLSRLADDDIITAKQARSLARKLAQEAANEAIRQREATTMDERLINRFPDFAQVVTKENIDLLKQQEPELAMSIYANSNNPYEQSIAAYKLIKKQGQGVSDEVAKNKQKAIENSKKPVSVQSVTKSSAIGNVHNFENGLTPELRKALNKEMEESRKRM